MPPLRAIERRMLNVWKSNKQTKRDDAQDEAARKLAQKAGEDDDEDETPSDHDDDTDEDTPEDDAPAPPADPPVADDEAIQLQCDALSAVRVADLRRRLRENGRADLATYRASDLDVSAKNSNSWSLS